MNCLAPTQVENIQRLLTGMSIRAVERYTGVHRDTIMRIKHQTTRKVAREDGLCRYISQAKRIAMYGLPILEDKRLGWTCQVPYCDNPDHFTICDNLNFGQRNYKPIRARLNALGDGEFLDLPDEPTNEKSLTKFRTGLIAHKAAHFLVRTLPTGGVRIVRSEGWHKPRTELRKVHPIFIGTERDWEPEFTSGGCVLAPTSYFARPKRHVALANPNPLNFTRDVTCGNPCCYAEAHLYLRPWRPVAKRTNEIGSTTLGLFWGTSIADRPIAPRVPCSVRGCAFLVNGDSGLCHTHRNFFEVEGYAGVIDVNDMFADDNGNDAQFTTGMMWEDRYNWLNVKKEGALGKSAAEKQNDAWWEENVVKAGLDTGNVITPKIRGSVLPEVLERSKQLPTGKTLTPGVGTQTSLHGKMRNHSKKKIRRVQRNRAQGWTGSRGDHDPIYFTRETLRALDYHDEAFDPAPIETLAGEEIYVEAD